MARVVSRRRIVHGEASKVERATKTPTIFFLFPEGFQPKVDSRHEISLSSVYCVIIIQRTRIVYFVVSPSRNSLVFEFFFLKLNRDCKRIRCEKHHKTIAREMSSTSQLFIEQDSICERRESASSKLMIKMRNRGVKRPKCRSKLVMIASGVSVLLLIVGFLFVSTGFPSEKDENFYKGKCTISSLKLVDTMNTLTLVKVTNSFPVLSNFKFVYLVKG